MAVFTTEKDIFAPRHVVGWTLFTLSAGFVNAGAVVACKNFVTHITGNVTNLAADPGLAEHFLLVVLAFIGGAMLAVVVAETAKARPKLAFALPLMCASLVLLGIASAGRAGHLGAFGAGEPENPRAFTMLVVLAAAMGMLNASVATATDNQVRVTHLTGPATDLAGNIVRAVLGTGRGSAVELRWALLRTAKFTAFAVGAGVATKLSARLEYDAFALAAAGVIVALGFTGAPDVVDAGDEAPEAAGGATDEAIDEVTDEPRSRSRGRRAG